MDSLLETYNDFVVFTSIKKELTVRYFKHGESYVAIHTNADDFLDYAFDPRFVFESCKKENIIGNVSVFYDKHIFVPRYDYSTYDEGSFIPRSHPMYIDGVTNCFFEIGDTETHIYHYPHELFNVFCKNSLNFHSVVSTEDDVIRELLYGTKKVLSRFNHKNEIYSIHGAAVSKHGKGYIFLSGSRAGKSSLFVNLIASGFKPINDDIVFWFHNNLKIGLHSCGTVPQIRKNAFKHVKCANSLHNVDFNNSHITSEIQSKADFDLENDIILDILFIPEIGYKNTTITRMDSASVLKKELRSCMVHGNYEVDEKFLDAFKALIEVPTFKINMSDNYEEICQTLNDFLENYS